MKSLAPAARPSRLKTPRDATQPPTWRPGSPTRRPGRFLRKLSAALLVGLGLASPARALPITPAELQKKLAAGELVALIDLRSTDLFQKGHLPGAMNIPAALCQAKKLPPLGYVVVYDDGLSPDSAAAAAAELGRKPGIRADVLEGGLPAWETLGGQTTRPSGVQPEQLPMITYAKLEQLSPQDVVLVDLRRPHPPASGSAKAGARTPASPPLTDLGARFPGARIVRWPFDPPAIRKSGPGALTPPLFVLIDNADGQAAEMARTLKGNGILRFVILIGGEAILEREGRAGLQRHGAGLHLPVTLPTGSNP
ncbi:MAG: rhodanese-like domain-containing protein [Verrucomicrobia bacterium]|nr:rhodanese-like domain-containing protein [Verrucomicrobiota bacterium]